MKTTCLYVFTTIVITFFSVQCLRSQAPDTLWTKKFGDENTQRALTVFPLNDGGFIIGGNAEVSGHSDFYLLKTNQMGELLWEKTIGETDRNETMTCIIRTSDGGFLLAGSRAEDYPYNIYSDIYLVKTDEEGNVDWSSIIGVGHESETPSSVAQTPDDGFILCGTFWVNSQNVNDVFLRKTNSMGLLEWTEFINFEDGKSDNGYWIEVAPDSGYLVTGTTQSFTGNYDYDAFILKTNSAGAVGWLNTYGSMWPYNEAGNRLLKTSDGGYLICGFRDNAGVDKNWYTVKTNEIGEQIWSHTIGGTYHDVAFNAFETADGGYIVTGNYYLVNWNCFIVKYNNVGDTLWTKMWGDADHSQVNYDIRQLDDGGYITVGTTTDGSGNPDIYLSRLEADVVGVERYSALTKNTDARIVSIYPNPFHQNTQISYEVFSNCPVEITVVDITGNLVTMLVNELKETGIYQTNLNEPLPAGIYYCRLTSGKYSDVKKLIIVK